MYTDDQIRAAILSIASENLEAEAVESFDLYASTVRATVRLTGGKRRSTFLSRIRVMARVSYPPTATDWAQTSLSDRIVQMSYTDADGIRCGHTVYIGYPTKEAARTAATQYQAEGLVAAFHIRKGRRVPNVQWEVKFWGLTHEALFSFLVADRPPVHFAENGEKLMVWLSESPGAGVHEVNNMNEAQEWAKKHYRRLEEAAPPTQTAVSDAIQHFLDMTGSSDEKCWSFNDWIHRNLNELGNSDAVAASYLALESDIDESIQRMKQLKARIGLLQRLKGQFSGHEGVHEGRDFTLQIEKGRRRVWLNCPPEHLPEKFQKWAVVGHSVTVDKADDPEVERFVTVTHALKVNIQKKETLVR